MGLLETAAATLMGGERRIETAARNVTNANTPGYKREIAYSEIVEKSGVQATSQHPTPVVASTHLAAQGGIVETGNPLDLAINGSAWMLVRDGESFSLSRGGQFALSRDGTLIDALGRAVQGAGGGDLEIGSASVEILTDGTVLDGDVPVGAIGLFDHGGFSPSERLSEEQAGALAEANTSELRQGATERSNVTLSDEMVDLMRTQRMVESGAQLVRAYDQLMSQAISTFSRSGS